MDPLTLAIIEVAHLLGVPPVAAAAGIPLFIMLSARVARVIPDSAEGPLKWIRIGARIFGMDTPNVTGKHKESLVESSVEDSTELAQGVLLLDETHAVNPFQRGAEKLRNRESSDGNY